MKPTHNISLGLLAWMLRHHRTIIRVRVYPSSVDLLTRKSRPE